MYVFPFVCCLTAMATLQSHTWTFEVSTFCCCCVLFVLLWENCVPKIDHTRAIFSRLGNCFGTPSLWRFLLVSIHNCDWQIFQGWNCGVGIVADWVRAVNPPHLQILRIDRGRIIDDVIIHETWRHFCTKTLEKDVIRIVTFDLIGLLPTNHITGYITMAYRSFWGNVQC